MNYISGEKVQIGDKVLIEHGKTEGIVYSIIETPKQLNDWSLDEPCLMLESEPFGMVSWQVDDDLQFVARKAS